MKRPRGRPRKDGGIGKSGRPLGSTATQTLVNEANENILGGRESKKRERPLASYEEPVEGPVEEPEDEEEEEGQQQQKEIQIDPLLEELSKDMQHQEEQTQDNADKK